MLIHKWSPVYDREVESGSSADDELTGVPQVDESLADEDVEETPEPTSREKLRADLEKNFKKSADDAEKAEKTPDKKPKAQKSRARQEMELDEQDDENLDVEVPDEEKEETEKPKFAAPKGFDKQAKADWAKVPASVQAAVAKRETDIEKGVAQLKQHYGEIDQVLAPRMEHLSKLGHTPAQAVHQLFSWFDQLALDPQRIQAGQAPAALLALGKSFGIDLEAMFKAAYQQPAKADDKGEQTEEGEVPTAVKTYIGQLEQKIEQLTQNVGQGFTNFQNTFAHQAQEQTNKILDVWSKNKPYFEEVRMDMANVLRSGIVPAKEDGSADLDAAYDRALYMNPDVREKVLADRRKAAIEKKRQAAEEEKKAQQKAADRARRASTGLGPSAPGVTLANEQKKPGKKSVRESLADAIGELSS